MLSFKPTFSLSSFTFIKRLFSPSSLSAIRVVSSECLRLLIFLPVILILAYAVFSPALSLDKYAFSHQSFPLMNINYALDKDHQWKRLIGNAYLSRLNKTFHKNSNFTVEEPNSCHCEVNITNDGT